jgi:hypothetical protein
MADSAHQLTSALLGDVDYKRVTTPYEGKAVGLDHADGDTIDRLLEAADECWASQGAEIKAFVER